MHYLTRIAYNSSGWHKPTGEAKKHEAKGTHNYKFGFGHEDWLFRSDWLIDEWRYAFIQGVNKSHPRLVREAEPFDLTLYTILPNKRRRFVATIRDVECLDNEQASEALECFKARGWYDIMLKEIGAVDGDHASLGVPDLANNILNVRFRLSNVEHHPDGSYAQADDPIHKRSRYQLLNLSKIYDLQDHSRTSKRSGSTELPRIAPVSRRGSRPIECTPEHARMQAKLMEELRAEFPGVDVIREKGFVDISVRTEDELLLFEIKSDLRPRTVIRHAIGQILEYAFHPSRKHGLPPRLVIVGRNELDPLDAEYLERLRKDFSLPVTYRVVPL